ncbi:MAG: flagellin [Limnochordia bacterium]|nr:flagellin [Limnochordia bacterium]MDD4516930.1 flagellin [Limnochordia bacterium]
MRINNNIMALNAHRQLGVNQTNASKSMERLSSGMRINRAGDDAAGLAISEKMRGQIRGLKQAARNAQDGISLIQTAEGALNETHAILQRMRELATQAATDTNTLTDRKEIQKEINQLLDEIDRIGNNTEFNTQNLLDGTYANKKIHIGANETQNMNIDISDMRTAALGGGEGAGGGAAVAATGTLEGISFEAKTPGAAGNTIEIEFEAGSGNDPISVSVIDSKITVTLGEGTEAGNNTVENVVNAINNDSSASALVIASGTGTDSVGTGNTTLAGGADADPDAGSGVNIDTLRVDVDAVADEAAAEALVNQGVLTQAGADAAITNINDAIEQVSAERSKLGAIQNRLEHTIANLGTSAENLQAAESRIRDLDMAEEMMAFTKNSILQQAATAMLAQANMAPQSVLQLLG